MPLKNISASAAAVAKLTTAPIRLRLELMLVLAVGLAGSVTFAASALAAPSPAWKLLAFTGPTNLPPKQSETQRVTVEAAGGTFTLGATSEGEGTLDFASALFSLTEGSDEADLFGFDEGTFAPGMVVSGPGIPMGTTITAVNGSTLVLSNAATSTEPLMRLSAASKEVTGVTTSVGAFHVGDTIAGTGIPSGTTVVSVGSGTLTLSEYPTSGGTTTLTATEDTGPIDFDASAATVQSSLEALPALGAGAVSVSGGPGGDAEHPWYVVFGGAYAQANVAQLVAGGGALLGDHSNVQVRTTVPGGNGTGEIAVYASNVGGAASSGPVTIEIGPLPPGVAVSGQGSGFGWSCSEGAHERAETCASTASVPGPGPAEPVEVPVEVESAIASTSSAPVTVSSPEGGSTTVQMPIVVSNEQVAPGVQAFWAGAFEADGTPSTQAGGHPASAVSDLELNTVRAPSGQIIPADDSKEVDVDLPPGFLGNPLVTARCPQALLTSLQNEESAKCGLEEHVGQFGPVVESFGHPDFGPQPIFNDVPAQGTAAEFTGRVLIPLQSLVGSVRSSEDFGIRVTAPQNPSYLKIYGSFVALAGAPAAAHGKAFLANPTDCAQQQEEAAQGRGPATLVSDTTWQQPTVFAHSSDSLPLLTGCQTLTEAWLGHGPEPEKEQPSFSFEPTITQGSSPTGATAHLHISQEGLTDPNKLAPSDLKKAVVTLPQGLSLNPSSANGLEACSEAQIGFLGSSFPSPNPTRFNEAPVGCPDGSKLGTFEIATPLLEEKLAGTIYLASQEENPFHSLIALYLVIESPRFGITVKLPGEVRPDPSTGQLTATFDNNPQLPFEDLTLHFRGSGGRSELATPEVCGSYKTTGSLTPWSAEGGESAQIDEPGFTVSGSCAASAASRPFAPSFEAGTTQPSAASYSPLVIKVNRNDGEQELTSLDFTLPEGLIGNLASVPYCSDAAIEAARSKSGRAEQASPSCPAASQIGSVDAAAGVGSEPIHVGGHVYMAGPYEGAPLSAVVITPAVAGPFDLGDVVIRTPLSINPATAQITVKSDPIPTILKGIQLKLRSVAVTLDRPGFTLNPTSCAAMSVTASIGSSNGATATPSNRFQVGGCSGLAFKPTLSASTEAKASKANGASLTVKVAAKPGEANIGKVNLQLPLQLPSRLSTLQKACTEAQFNANPAACPAESVIGSGTAHTPILQVPLSGPAYLVSHGGAAFPDVEFVLQADERGGNVEIVLDGGTQIKKGITYSNFETVPDAPISSFETVLPEGPHSIVTAYLPAGANYNLCGQSLKMPTTITGQNGAVLRQNTPIAVTGCAPAIRVTKHTVKGTATTLVVSVPSAGKLTAKGPGLTSAAKTVSAAKSVTLTLKLNKKEQAFLARHHHRKLKLQIKLQFTPKKGARLTTATTVLVG